MAEAYPPTPGMNRAIARVIAGIEAGERRQVESQRRQRLNAAAPGIAAAAKRVIKAAGGDLPPKLRTAISELGEHLEHAGA